MDKATRKVAIILRGPPAVGKSSIRDRIVARLGGQATVRTVNLDAYWGPPHEWRYNEVAFRYADLQLAKEPVLVVALSSGEPPDLSFPGATRAAQEWVALLRQSGREVFPFLLWMDWNAAVTRLLARHRCNLHQVMRELGLYSLYEHQHQLATFPAIPHFQEHRIVTSSRTVDNVADEILQRAGLP
jgi:hypothetical protein